jgi:hypothetical protein
MTLPGAENNERRRRRLHSPSPFVIHPHRQLILGVAIVGHVLLVPVVRAAAMAGMTPTDPDILDEAAGNYVVSSDDVPWTRGRGCYNVLKKKFDSCNMGVGRKGPGETRLPPAGFDGSANDGFVPWDVDDNDGGRMDRLDRLQRNDASKQISPPKRSWSASSQLEGIAEFIKLNHAGDKKEYDGLEQQQPMLHPGGVLRLDGPPWVGLERSNDDASLLTVGREGGGGHEREDRRYRKLPTAFWKRRPSAAADVD